MMSWRSFLAVAIGGMLGCLLRWANLIGCYIIGIAVGFFLQYPAFAPEWRLFITTGFCGGLTTFSTFSAEIVLQMQSGRYSSALVAVGVHVIGSLLMTIAGIATVGWINKA
jgi:CrcB protein